MPLSKIQSAGIESVSGVAGGGNILQVVNHTETDFTTFTFNGTQGLDTLLLASNAQIVHLMLVPQ